MIYEYKLVTLRRPDGEYSTELYHGSQKINLEDPVQHIHPSLFDAVYELTEDHINILSHFKNEINRLETIISGENLR